MSRYSRHHHRHRHQDHRKDLLVPQGGQEDVAIVEVHLTHGDTVDQVTMKYPLADQDHMAGDQKMI